MSVVIYGKSGCVHCDDAKELSKVNGIPFVWKDVTEGDTKKELLLLVPNAKTVPQIFVNGNHVGGFTEYKEYSKSKVVAFGKIL